MAAPLTITLPIPDYALSPNGRPSRMAKARAVRLHRYWAMLAALSAQNKAQMSGGGRHFPDASTIIVSATVYRPPRGRIQDDDNLKASCKSYLDGFTDAGIWQDDRAARWGDVAWLTQDDAPDGTPGVAFTLTAQEGSPDAP